MKINAEGVIDSFIKVNYAINELNYPFINIDDENGVKKYFVVVNDIKYKVPSLLKALDILFKSIFIFNLKYPAQALHIFTLIERYFFKIEITKYINSDILRLVKELPVF